MIDLEDILGNLTQGELPLSIGTSFAIESACGVLKDRDSNGNPLPTPPKTPPLNKVNELWINVRTVFRNLYNAINPDIKDVLTPSMLFDATVHELRMIPNCIQQIMGDKIKVVFYACTYKGLPNMFPLSRMKTPTTPKQVEYWDFEQTVVNHILSKNYPVKKFDVKINGEYSNAMIMTHLPVDLLWKHSFGKLYLLESHTGKVKKSSEWNSKLGNGKDNPQLPFNEFTIQIFGDNGNFFSPMIQGIKKPVIELSIERKWTAVTTKEKIQYDINTIKDHVLRNFLNDLLRSGK